MAWQSPKTNWGASDGVRDSDLNRIEGNILELHNLVGLHSEVYLYVNASSGNDTTGTGTAAAPFATLSRALQSINRNIGDEVVTINIIGSFLDNVTIRGFTAPIIINATGLTSLLTLTIDGCTVLYTGSQLNVSRGIVLKHGALFYSTSITYVGGSNSYGIDVQTGSTFIVLQTVTISNSTSVGLEVSTHGRAYVSTLAGTGNAAVGFRASSGGVICYGSTSIAATTQSVTNTGGRIYAGAQTSVPNY